MSMEDLLNALSDYLLQSGFQNSYGMYDMQDMQQTLEELIHRLRVSAPVRLLTSSLVAVPTVVGWLRPVIPVQFGNYHPLRKQDLLLIVQSRSIEHTPQEDRRRQT